LDRLAVDPVNDEIYVPGGTSVLVFPREAEGDVAPVRVLTGPDTRLYASEAVAIDTTRNLLVVLGARPRIPGQRRGSELMIFERTADGNTAPKRVISGLRGAWNIALLPERGLVFAVQRGYVGIWSLDDEGEVPPRFTIGGPDGILRSPRGIGIDVENQSVIVSDKHLNAVLTFHVPEIFAATATDE
jgi:hypothetical protein